MRPFFGIDGELHVGAARIDADFPQAANGAVAHHLVFAVGKGLGRRHRDRIAGVHAHRIEILDRADDDAVVGQVAHHLELEFLPAERALFDEHFVNRGERDAALQDVHEFFAVIGDAAAGSAQCEAGTQDAGVADPLGEFQAASTLLTSCDCGVSRPILRIASLNSRRSSAFLMASILAPISSTPYFSRMPASASSTERLSPVCPPTVESSASGRSAG